MGLTGQCQICTESVACWINQRCMRDANYDRIFFESTLWLRSLVVAVRGTVKDMLLSRASTWSDARQGSTRSSSALHRHVDTVKDLRSYTISHCASLLIVYAHSIQGSSPVTKQRRRLSKHHLLSAFLSIACPHCSMMSQSKFKTGMASISNLVSLFTSLNASIP